MAGRVSKLLFCKHFYYYKRFPHLPETMNDHRCSSTISLLHRYSTASSSTSSSDDASENLFLRKLESGYEDNDERLRNQHPPNPIPNRPLRGEKRRDSFKLGNDGDDDDYQKMKPSRQIPRTPHFENRSMTRGGGGGGRTRDDHRSRKDDLDGFTSSKLFDPSSNSSSSSSRIHNDKEEEMNQTFGNPPVQFPNNRRPISGEKRDDQSVASFLEKFNLDIGDEKKENDPFENKAGMSSPDREEEAPQRPPPPPEDADEIFKKMKETGLIPNAVAMLDGLCKDGLVQEAMKLFGLMREKGTIPEVVIYTAVVEGFCKAQKLDDAKRIFRKMQNNGISPNAFSYTVLIQGLLSKGMRRLEDALDFCVEMLEAGHTLNVVTFVSLVDGFVTDKGVEEANSVIGRLTEKGFCYNEKAVREHLDKNGPFSSLVWEAIFGKKSSQRPF